MSIRDIWKEAQYFWIDLTNYTKAEKNVKKYGKVVSELNRKIPLLQEHLSENKAMVNVVHEQFRVQDHCAEGHIKEFFDKKETLWNSKCENLQNRIKEALSTSIDRRDEAKRLLSYWESEVASEETQVRNQLWNKKEEQQKEEEANKNGA